MKLKLWLVLVVISLVTVGEIMAQKLTPTYALYQEPFRPQYHYSPPCRWMNDPNGMVYYEGEYHLFYQFNPEDTVWGPMYWGHAVSTDLVHWTTLPMALSPDDNGTIFSGSAVVDVNNTAGFGENALVAIYSYSKQSQGVAYSTDKGRTWTKYAYNPIIPALEKDFRDPKVFWYEPLKQWTMIISAGHKMQIFTSPDLLHWQHASDFSDEQVSGVWEVPDLFPLEIDGQTKWVMIVNIGRMAPAGGSGTKYFVGQFDGHTFTSDNPNTTLWLDYGADNYAGTTWSNAPDGKIIFIAWMNNWAYAQNIPTSTWRGATILPREFKLVHTSAGIRLAQAPVAAFDQLRKPLGTWDNLALNGMLPLSEVHGRTLEIIAEFEADTAERFGLAVHHGDSGATRIVYNTKQQQVLIGRPPTTGELPDFNTAFGAPLPLENNRVRLHIYVDQSSVEVFSRDGTIALTAQTFVDPANDGMVLFAEKGTAKLVHLEIYAMSSIWDKEAQRGAEFTFCQ